MKRQRKVWAFTQQYTRLSGTDNVGMLTEYNGKIQDESTDGRARVVHGQIAYGENYDSR